MTIVIPEIYHDSPGTCSSFAHAFEESQLFRNCALASSKVDTRSERVIGPVMVNDQNQRK